MRTRVSDISHRHNVVGGHGGNASKYILVQEALGNRIRTGDYRPAHAIEVLDQGLHRVGQLVHRVTHSPDVSCRVCRYGVKHVSGGARVRTWYYAPGTAIPVLDQR